ncbi:P-loop containing nucleoside triphosphate hydrolase protein [Pluteus cervinus]|uniref:P-loop containing nucleoside triphosphate hydrolase protein n=1 Tax=Pluteus cervinus TaxID=181527 RepID=A0ACD3AVD2_9AGAR|nr:P-loop containing nucleoside triphosphate hydrolase protein [Pluteus cervinus]
MPSTTSTQVPRPNGKAPHVNGKHFDKSKKYTSFGDGSDDERPRKTPLVLNGSLTNGKAHGPNGQRHKKPRPSRFNGQNGLVNGQQDGSSKTSLKPSSIALQAQRKSLPIAKGRQALIDEINKHDITVLLGETGSGKTTQIPQYLLESGLAGTGIIAVTQPRKVAATSLAERVAAERGTLVGKLVGYSVRFDERVGPDTRIKYMTDGMIVRELLSDRLLSNYSVVIVDEAHERTLRTDLLMASLKRIQRERNSPTDLKGKSSANRLNPLKIIIMSATLDAEKFSTFYENAKIIYIKGRQHPVKIFHTAQGQQDYGDSAMRTFFQIHTDRPPGDVLIFLPEDIESLQKSIQVFAKRLPQDKMEVLICPMYAAQAPIENAKVFHPTPPRTRKCILATNIAETSLTIPGVKYVIDTGKCKEKRYLTRDTGGGFDALLTTDITKSSAMQRAGRAGREGTGFCFRLYTEEAYSKMELSTQPEILRCSLVSSLLQLKCLGEDLDELELMDKPDDIAIISAYKSLWLLDAINKNKEITPLGHEMAHFPLEPAYARAVIASKEYGCTSEVLDIISILSSSSKLFLDISEQREAAAEARLKFKHSSGDHLTILNVVRAYHDISQSEAKAARKDWCRKHFLNERTLLEANNIREQLRRVCSRLHIDYNTTCRDDEQPIIRSIAHGLVQNSAFIQPDGSYKQSMAQSLVKIHPSSSLCDKKVEAIIYDELIYTNQIYARGVSSIHKSFFATLGTLIQRQA